MRSLHLLAFNTFMKLVFCLYLIFAIESCTQTKEEKTKISDQSKNSNIKLQALEINKKISSEYQNEEMEDLYKLDSLVLKIFDKDILERIRIDEQRVWKVQKLFRIVSFKYSNLNCPKICPIYEEIISLDSSNSIVDRITVHNFMDVKMNVYLEGSILQIDSLNFSIKEAGEEIIQVPKDSTRYYYNIDSLGHFVRSI